MGILELKKNQPTFIKKDMVKLLNKHLKLKVMESGVLVVMVTNQTLNDHII